MTKISYTEKDGKISLYVSGHANYNEDGKDIVCAAVSALTQAFLLAISEHHALDRVDIRKGIFRVDVSNCGERESGMFATTVSGLKAIAEVYPDFVKVVGEKFKK